MKEKMSKLDAINLIGYTIGKNIYANLNTENFSCDDQAMLEFAKKNPFAVQTSFIAANAIFEFLEKEGFING
jgi:hypothetical protein